jgi:hypothetical protein
MQQQICRSKLEYGYFTIRSLFAILIPAASDRSLTGSEVAIGCKAFGLGEGNSSTGISKSSREMFQNEGVNHKMF